MSKDFNDLQTIVSQFQDSYNVTAAASIRDAKLRLQPGDAVPEEGKIIGDVFRNEFESLANGYRERAGKIIDGKIKGYEEYLTAAPSDEAVRVISMLGNRDHISSEEFDLVVEKYGDNYQAYKALNDIGARNGYHLAENERQAEYEALKGFKRSMDTYFSLSGAENVSKGKIAFTLAASADLFE